MFIWCECKESPVSRGLCGERREKSSGFPGFSDFLTSGHPGFSLYLCRMKIGFDAKRAYHNGTGLGHYSRTLLQSLAEFYPGNEYYLFNPRPSKLFELNGKNLHEVLPSGILNRSFPSAWRSSWVKKDLIKQGIDLYHGLSHEIPVGIKKTAIRSVVTIHDLIHERYPAQYSKIDVKIYSKKFRYACEHADRIIAISQQTKQDIIDFYKIPAGKIDICYQSCNPSFCEQVSEEQKALVRERYKLPKEFFLSVGSIIERKNLLNICKALFLLRNDVDIPLVVIGDGGKYKRQVQDFILQNGLKDKVIFLSDDPLAKSAASFKSAKDFPAIYQLATAMIYPSFFEGFGIPVLEALWSRLPVITSNVACLPEAGGDGAHYVDPRSAEEIATAMKTIYTNRAITTALVEKGWQHAQHFTTHRCATAVMNVYKSIW